MNEQDSQEIWQVDVGGQVYESNLEALTQWIFEGSLHPQDKIRRGNLRWIEARKVPSLIPFFNAKENGLPPPLVLVSVSDQNTNSHDKNKCAIHTGSEPAYKCETCINSFCESCISPIYNPSKYCPMCGAVCVAISKTTTSFTNSPQTFPATNTENSFPTQNDFQPNQYAQSFPSDLANTNKKKGMGTFVMIFVSIIGASIFSYLWAYQFYTPNKLSEDALPQVVTLDEKFKAEKEAEERRVVVTGTSQNIDLSKINNNGIQPGSSKGSSGSGNLPYKIEVPNVAAFQKQTQDAMKNLTVNTKVAAGQPTSATTSAKLGEIEKKYLEERNKVIEKYHGSKQSNSFFGSFILSFLMVFGILFGIKSLQNK